MRIFGTRTLSKNVINVPDLPDGTPINAVGKDPKIFPTAKYIIVSKTFESKKSYKIKGIPRRTKVYGVGILTDKNRYYFSEIHSRHQELTNEQRIIFSGVFTSRYIITENTKLLVSDNINHHDPIFIFLKIVSSTVGFNIRRTNLYKMLKYINYELQYFKGSKKNYALNRWYCKRMVNKLIEMKRFEFITTPDWEAKMDLMVAHVKKAYIECAVGILSMYLRDIDKMYLQHMYDNKARKRIEELKKDRSEPV